METTTENLKDLSIAQLAAITRANWGAQGKGVNYAAAPYLSAMFTLESIDDRYGLDDGSMIVRYFLGNASSWRGDTAKAVKAELKRRLK